MLHFLWTGRKDSGEAPYSTLGWVNALFLADVYGNDEHDLWHPFDVIYCPENNFLHESPQHYFDFFSDLFC